MAADETPPAQGFHLFEFGDDPERIGRALTDYVESGAKAL